MSSEHLNNVTAAMSETLIWNITNYRISHILVLTLVRSKHSECQNTHINKLKLMASKMQVCSHH